MLSYTDLTLYRKCPRLFAFHRAGYQPPAMPRPMTTGSFVHSGLSAYFRGQSVMEAINKAEVEAVCKLRAIQDRSARNAALDETMAAAKIAHALLARYVDYWGNDYLAPLVEPELVLGSVVCHPDLIAYYQEQRVIVDFKTSSHSPDVRWYDISGQADLYAYVYSAALPANPPPIDLVIYDTISEEGLYRHQRPPRLEAGERLFNAIVQLALDVGERREGKIGTFGDEAHPVFDCPTRCNFFRACWLSDTDSYTACLDYLEANYLKEADSETQRHLTG